MFGARFSAMLIAAAVAVTALPRPSCAFDIVPFLGTWVLDAGQSNFQFDQPLKSSTISTLRLGDGLVRCTADSVEADGKSAQHVEFSTTFSGKPDATSGSAYFDSVINRPINATSYKTVFLKGGRQVETQYHIIAKDGKTLRVVEAASDIGGRSWNYDLVFRRQ